jgi:hypothetical protein
MPCTYANLDTHTICQLKVTYDMSFQCHTLLLPYENHISVYIHMNRSGLACISI